MRPWRSIIPTMEPVIRMDVMDEARYHGKGYGQEVYSKMDAMKARELASKLERAADKVEEYEQVRAASEMPLGSYEDVDAMLAWQERHRDRSAAHWEEKPGRASEFKESTEIPEI